MIVLKAKAASLRLGGAVAVAVVVVPVSSQPYHRVQLRRTRTRRVLGMASASQMKTMQQQQQQQRQRKPACVVFDLDGCLWSPEMYELSWMGSGPPFSPRINKGRDGGGYEEEVMVSRRGDEVRLLGDVREVIRELHCSPEWRDTRVGISSRCDEPDWARELLRKFTIDNGRGGSFALVDAFDPALIQIRPGDKTEHFEQIAAQSGVALDQMIFFDNEHGNIRSVSRLGVTCILSPHGITSEVWHTALANFPTQKPVRP